MQSAYLLHGPIPRIWNFRHFISAGLSPLLVPVVAADHFLASAHFGGQSRSSDPRGQEGQQGANRSS